MVDVVEDYMRLSFEPVLAPQPYQFTREYCSKLLWQTQEFKKQWMLKLITGKKANLLDMEDTGVVFLGRINFGLGSLLAKLGTVTDFRAILAEMEV